MKICITSQGDNLDSNVDPRFGRCQYFIFLETDTLEFEAIQNPNIEAMGGAGVMSAQFVASREVNAILTGNIGPNAFRTLQAAGIGVFAGASGTIKEAVDKYKKGEFKETQNPSVGSKFGMPPKNK